MSMTPKVKKEPILRSFNDETEMIENAERMYAKKGKDEKDLDKENGFDIDDPASIEAFDPEYTPLANTVLLKRLPLEIQEKNGVKIIDNSGSSLVFVVVVPGMYVTLLKKGDRVKLTTGAASQLGTQRTFKQIKFEEFDYYNISGVLLSRGVLEQRLKEQEQKKNAQL